MDEPTLDEVRKAKTELIKLLRGRRDFAGAGIGIHDGHLVVKVNWRALPPENERPGSVGRLDVTHHEIGRIRAQSSD